MISPVFFLGLLTGFRGFRILVFPFVLIAILIPSESRSTGRQGGGRRDLSAAFLQQPLRNLLLSVRQHLNTNALLRKREVLANDRSPRLATVVLL